MIGYYVGSLSSEEPVFEGRLSLQHREADILENSKGSKRSLALCFFQQVGRKGVEKGFIQSYT